MPTSSASTRRSHTSTSELTDAGSPSTLENALSSAERWHHGQRRASGAPYIEHPLEVARLLNEFGASDAVVTAGVLHDVLEKSDATAGELEDRFGATIAQLVVAVSDSDADAPFRDRKRDLRTRVERAGGGAVLILAADSVSKVRELRRLAAREPKRFSPGSDEVLAKLEHYQSSVRMLRRVAGGHPLVGLLRAELAGYSRGTVPVG